MLHYSDRIDKNNPLKELPRTQHPNIMLHFEGNPMKADRKIRSQSMIHLEPSEVLSVLRAAKNRGAREWAMTLLAYKHGMRASEVCAIRLDELDLKNGSIVVERLKGSLRTTQAVTEHRGEPLLNEVKAIREWLRERVNDGSNYLFTSQKGGRLDRSQFFRLFKAISRAAGLPAEKQHPHALKHSIASHLISANVNLALVKQQLGHKSIGSTMRYVTTTDQQASKATTSALMTIY
jgi:type 1 fimbriae regulatory protein FimB